MANEAHSRWKIDNSEEWILNKVKEKERILSVVAGEEEVVIWEGKQMNAKEQNSKIIEEMEGERREEEREGEEEVKAHPPPT